MTEPILIELKETLAIVESDIVRLLKRANALRDVIRVFEATAIESKPVRGLIERQNFLTSNKARSLSIADIEAMSDDEAFARFNEIRWSANDGSPYCPRCGCEKVYAFMDQRRWKCAACRKIFTVTSGTLFHSHKLPIRVYLIAIAMFINSSNEISVLQAGNNNLGVSYKTALSLAHRLRGMDNG